MFTLRLREIPLTCMCIDTWHCCIFAWKIGEAQMLNAFQSAETFNVYIGNGKWQNLVHPGNDTFHGWHTYTLTLRRFVVHTLAHNGILYLPEN